MLFSALVSCINVALQRLVLIVGGNFFCLPPMSNRDFDLPEHIPNIIVTVRFGEADERARS